MQTPYEKFIPYKLRALLRISSTPTDLDEGGVAAHVGGEDDVAHQGSDRHPLRQGQVPQQVDVLAHLRRQAVTRGRMAVACAAACQRTLGSKNLTAGSHDCDCDCNCGCN